ncbi:methyl-accepting chemotaxis sensory transducer [Mobilisporobacter senegalensis]|uniref:Methyl-accepting chemotaxis sensory transducer n=1 Tax=Mobilisporobacter senegalensis TaxID=1329262 RepID=A0A3N1XQF3_9FIRM|nr:HAMP domain-containing methyl-accepting chemotaxis protein [Mobilisporobacter senegalensis]ROR27322.1 methyl-accepting chemotaxis sensory transducer [Mobilisporobacter senegalensis]
MKWYYNLKIAAKLIIGFIIVAMIAGIVGVVGIININKINNLDTEMYERHTATMPALADIARNYQRQRVVLHKLYIVKDGSNSQIYIDEYEECRIMISDSITKFQAGIKNPDVQESFDLLTQTINDFEQFGDEIIELIQSNKTDEAYEHLTGSYASEIANTAQKETDNLMKLKTDDAKESSDFNNATAKTASFTMITVIGAGVLISIFLGVLISRIISKPVNQMVESADKLALGDVNVSVAADTKDEIGSLARAFDRMIENIRGQALVAEKIAEGDLTVEVAIRSEKDLLGKMLARMVDNNNEVLSNIATASEQVAVGSKQVSDSSISLSQGATEQASSVEELTASLEEISSQTQLNAGNARKANDLSENAKVNAMQGNTQMQDMLKSMEEINESSANIYKIIKVIDDIAFQTNILALNAAVEAARAGQHGKGFAVVAEEVRTLAARSASAAKETTDMIEDSIKKAENGTKIAKETAEALNKIVSGIEEVADIVNNISIASEEQATGIEQINQGIMQVSEVVQNNSATSEESAAASEELSSQAALLKDLVSRFKIKQNVKYNGTFNDINPDVLLMLESMANKKENISQEGKISEVPSVSKPKIVLSDKDFGKY